MIKVLIYRPIGVLTTLAFIICFAWFLSLKVPISLLPQTEIPKLKIKFDDINQNADDILNIYILPCVQLIQKVSGTQDISYNAAQKGSVINVTFDPKEDMEQKIFEISTIIDKHTSTLPKNFNRPTILHPNINDIPLIKIAVFPKLASSEDLSILSSPLSTLIKNQFEQEAEISKVTIEGIMQYKLSIQLNQSKMIKFGLTTKDILESLSTINTSEEVVKIQDNNNLIDLVFSSNILTPSDLQSFKIFKNNNFLSLGEFCEVKILENTLTYGQAYYNGKKCLIFNIIKTPVSSTYSYETKINLILKNLKSSYHQYHFVITDNQIAQLDDSISSFKTTIILGILIASLMLFLIYYNFRLGIIIGINLLTSIALSVILIYIFDISFDLLTLTALIICVGMTVDNAIIIIDSINRNVEIYRDIDTGIVNGISSVFFSLVTSSATTLFIFLPLILVNGMLGKILTVFALTISFVLLSSLLISIISIPVLYKLFIKKAINIPFTMLPMYVNKLLTKPFVIISVFCSIIILGPFVIKKIGKEVIPNTFENEMDIDINFEKAQPYLFRQTFFEQFALQWPSANFYTFNAKNFDEKVEYNEKQIRFRLRYDGIKPKNEITNMIRDSISSITSNAAIEIYPRKNLLEDIFLEDLPEYYIKVYPNDVSEKVHKNLVQSMIKIIKPEKLMNSQNQSNLSKSIISFKKEKIYSLGLTEQYVNDEINMLLNNRSSLKLTINQKEFISYLGYQNEYENIHKNLVTAKILHPKQNVYYDLKDLISIEPAYSIENIEGDINGPFVAFNLLSESEISSKQLKELVRLGAKIEFSGMKFVKDKLLIEFTYIGLLVVLLLFLILSIQFESILVPLVILSLLPICLVGSLIILYISGSTLNVFSLSAILLTFGISLNDSILKTDSIMQSLKAGNNILDSITKANTNKFWPIVSTTLTTIFGFLPVLFYSGEQYAIQKSMAYAILGGLSFGTIASILFLPSILLLFYQRKAND